MSKIETLVQQQNEKKMGKKRYIQYTTTVTLDNGNICIVDKVEYYRNTKKLVYYYINDTDKLLKTVEYLQKYYKYTDIHEKTQSQAALAQAASCLLKLSEMYPNFDIMKVEQNKQVILDNFEQDFDLERLSQQVQLDPTLVKAILVLKGKLVIQ